MRTQSLFGNNGSCPCSLYCAKDWENSLAASGWSGAVCQSSYTTDSKGNQTAVPCDVATNTNQVCVCQEAPGGFLPNSLDGSGQPCGVPTAWAGDSTGNTGNNGSCPCSHYCAKNWGEWAQKNPISASWHAALSSGGWQVDQSGPIPFGAFKEEVDADTSKGVPYPFPHGSYTAIGDATTTNGKPILCACYENNSPGAAWTPINVSEGC